MTHERKELNNTRTYPTTRTAKGSSSSTTTVYTDPGVLHDLMIFKQQWNALIGPMNAQIAFYVESLMEMGMEMPVILNALDQTAWARRPSPSYFRAILQRYRAEGVLTMEQLAHDNARFEEVLNRRNNAWWNNDCELPY